MFLPTVYGLHVLSLHHILQLYCFVVETWDNDAFCVPMQAPFPSLQNVSVPQVRNRSGNIMFDWLAHRHVHEGVAQVIHPISTLS